MPLIPLKLQPGMFRNGTDYEQSNRWQNGSLVRWSEGSLRPVGGWTAFTSTTLSGAPRGMHGWRANDGDDNIAVSTYNKLYYISASAGVTDITPAGLVAGAEDATQNTGYGGGFYGLGIYSAPRTPSATYAPATTWSLDNWGEYLVACSVDDGKLYEWQLNPANPAAVITNAPVDNIGLVVTEERFIFALGAGGNPRKVAWCDREDNTLWTPDATNEAGDIELQTSGSIKSGIRVRGRTLIVTDADAHIATYQGPPYVYGFERIGSACGTEAPLSLIGVDHMAFWMGQKGFFMFDGSLPREINCDVSDYVFKDINTNQISKVVATHNSRFSEVWWFYPSADSLENNRYVTFDYKDNIWSFGVLSRTSGIDTGILRYPVWADATGILYFHEYGYNHNGESVFIESGPISLGNGDQVMKVNQVIPDELTQGGVNMTFKTRFYPNDTEREYGPFSAANPTDVRFTGRQIRVRYDSQVSTDWRVGTFRVEASGGGRR
jgi:hypothetical protein